MLPPSTQYAIKQLSPPGLPSKSEENQILIDAFPSYFKFKHNTFDLEPGTGLCVNISRFNHSCLPNCCRQYIPDHKIMLISAGLKINPGDELTICYTEKNLVDGYKMHQQSIYDNWGFLCKCIACKETTDGNEKTTSTTRNDAINNDKNNTLQNTLVKISKMDQLLGKLANSRKPQLAYNVGVKLLKLYEQIPIRTFHFQRTYHDMYQLSILKKETLKQAELHLKKTVEYYEYLLGGSNPECIELQTIKKYLKHPKSHPLYLALE